MSRNHRKPFNNLRNEDMSSSQLERLKKDSREINHYMVKLKKLGRTKLAHKVLKRYEFITSRINDLEDEYLKECV